MATQILIEYFFWKISAATSNNAEAIGLSYPTARELRLNVGLNPKIKAVVKANGANFVFLILSTK